MTRSIEAFEGVGESPDGAHLLPLDIKVDYGARRRFSRGRSRCPSRLITVTPWDAKMIGPIEKAIQASGLGLNPASDGKVVRIPIPPLTEERRKELVKLVKKMAEDARVAVRNVRREAIERIKEKEKKKEISEDAMKRGQDRAQKETDAFIKKIDDILKAKEQEIMEV